MGKKSEERWTVSLAFGLLGIPLFLGGILFAYLLFSDQGFSELPFRDYWLIIPIFLIFLGIYIMHYGFSSLIPKRKKTEEEPSLSPLPPPPPAGTA